MKIKKSTIRDMCSTALVWSVVFFSVLSIMESNGWKVHITIPLYIYEIIVLVGILLINRKKIELKKDNLTWICLFSLHIMCCTFLGVFGKATFNWQMKRTAELAVAPIIGYYFAKGSTLQIRKKFYLGLYIATIGTIIYGFINYFEDLAFQDRADSIFGHAIPYSTIIAMFLFMTNYLFDELIVKMALCVIFIVGSISTFSRSSWISILLVGFLLLFSNKRNSKIEKKKLYRIFGVVILVLLGLAVFKNQLMVATEHVGHLVGNRITGTMESVSATQRLGTIGYMIQNIGLLGFLYGHGNGQGGAFLSSTTIVLSNFATTDNQYVSILYDFGLIGMCVTIALLVSAIKTIWNRDKDEEMLMLASSILAASISAFFYEMLGWINVAGVFLILIGIYCSRLDCSVKEL